VPTPLFPASPVFTFILPLLLLLLLFFDKTFFLRKFPFISPFCFFDQTFFFKESLLVKLFFVRKCFSTAISNLIFRFITVMFLLF